MFVWWQKAHLACKNRAPAIIKGKPSGSQTNLEWTLEKQAVQQITKVVVVVAVTVACGNSKLLCAERVNYGNQLLSEPENVAIIWQANAELQDSKNEVISVSQFTFKFNYTDIGIPQSSCTQKSLHVENIHILRTPIQTDEQPEHITMTFTILSGQPLKS